MEQDPSGLTWRLLTGDGAQTNLAERLVSSVRIAGLGIVLLVMCACGREPGLDEAVEAPSGDPSVRTDFEGELLDRMSGVWVAPADSGPGAGTVYVLMRSFDHGVMITRDGLALDVQTDDIDSSRKSATFRSTQPGSEQSLRFILTDTVVQSDDVAASITTLKLVYWDGTQQELSFLRELSHADIQGVLNARLAASLALDGKSSSTAGHAVLSCDSPADFRMRSVCGNEILLWLHRRFVEYMESLRRNGVDMGSTEAAALKQLDACSDSECLQSVYKAWLTYLEQNYGEQAGTRADP